MSVYNLQDHPLITQDGGASTLRANDPDAIDEHEALAVDVLASWYDWVATADASHDDYDTIRRAVALQAIHQINSLPEAQVYTRVKTGDEWLEFRDNPVSNAAMIALSRVDSEMDYDTFRGVR